MGERGRESKRDREQMKEREGETKRRQGKSHRGETESTDRERSFQWIRLDIKATSMGHQNPFHVSKAGEGSENSFEGSPCSPSQAMPWS